MKKKESINHFVWGIQRNQKNDDCSTSHTKQHGATTAKMLVNAPRGVVIVPRVKKAPRGVYYVAGAFSGNGKTSRDF